MILKSHRRRVVFFGVAMLLGYVLLTARLFQLQVSQGERWAAYARHMRQIKIDRPRGAIFDRNGNKLALSLPVHSLYADPRLIEEPDRVAEELARILQLDAPGLVAKLRSPRSFVWLARKLDRTVVERVRALGVKGLGFRSEYQRFYPNDTLAANLLGFVGLDGEGLEGLEFGQDQVLASRAGEKLVLAGLTGLEIPKGEAVVREAEGGDNLELTIDEVIQHLCEKEAQLLFDTWQPKSCFILVMVPQTGEVLACAVRPTFDPNRFQSFPDWTYQNRALVDLYEPGSVFKIVPAAAALEDERIAPDTTFDCPGYIKLYDIAIRCTGVHGDVNLRHIIEKSCNAGIAKVGRVLGPESLYYYIRKFGFGERTGIEMPGEVEGLVRLPRNWSGLSPAAIAMGQEVGVTGVQMISAVCAIANGGNLIRPQVIHRVLAPDGTVKRDFKPEVRRRVVREEVAVELASMMQRVVIRGTGRRGRLDLWTAAGKTGTSQKLGSGTNRVVTSFAGFVPVHTPAAAIYIVVNEPRGERPSGATVAAPVFGRLAAKIMLYLGVPPDQVADGQGSPGETAVADEEPAPQVNALAVQTAGSPQAAVQRYGVAAEDVASGALNPILRPLPGQAGTGGGPTTGGQVARPAGEAMTLDDGSSEIGQVIDAAVQGDSVPGAPGAPQDRAPGGR